MARSPSSRSAIRAGAAGLVAALALFLLACVGGGGVGGVRGAGRVGGDGVIGGGGTVPSGSEGVQEDRVGTEREAPAATLLPAGVLPGRHFIRQWVEIRWPGGEERFEAVLQKEGDSLLLVGLGPMGRIGFRISLEDEELGLQNDTGQTMPFSPAYILADVQRIFYPWLEPWLEEEQRCRSCRRRGARRGLEIEEHRVEGRLVERRFSVSDRPSLGEVVVRYDRDDPNDPDGRGDGPTPPGAARAPQAGLWRATLRNDWVGYEIEVEFLPGEWRP